MTNTGFLECPKKCTCPDWYWYINRDVFVRSRQQGARWAKQFRVAGCTHAMPIAGTMHPSLFRFVEQLNVLLLDTKTRKSFAWWNEEKGWARIALASAAWPEHRSRTLDFSRMSSDRCVPWHPFSRLSSGHHSQSDTEFSTPEILMDAGHSPRCMPTSNS